MIANRKMLVADDSVTIQKVVQLTFADEGMHVDTASDGDQAINQLEKDEYDIVLADIFIPGPNGYEICEHIKRNEQLRHIPVLLLVGTFEPFNEAEARRVGADDVLTKPFQSIKDLVSKVSTLLNSKPDAEEDTTREHPKPVKEQVDSAGELRPASEQSGSAASNESPLEAAPMPVAAEQSAGREESFETSSLSPEEQPSSEFQTDERGYDFNYQTASATPAAEASGDHAANDESDEDRLAADSDILLQTQPTAPLADPHLTSNTIVNENKGETGKSLRYVEVFDQVESPPPAQAPEQQSEAASNNEFDALTLTSPDSTANDSMAFDTSDMKDSPSLYPDYDSILDLDDMSGAPSAPTAEAATDFSHDLRDTAAREDAATILDLDTPQVTDRGDAQQYREDAVDVGSTSDTSGSTKPLQAAGQATAGATEQSGLTASPAGTNQQIRLEQLAPEVIDAIARRVVEQLSDQAIREIAWEVVPQLSELLIKRRLEEENRGTR